MASTLKVTEITTPDGTGNITVSRPLSSVQLGGVLDVNGNYVQTEKGGDIASASPLVIDTDGDYFDVTGTTNFAAMTVAADRQFTLQFDGALTMTHHATNLDLPGEANITTAAGDVAVFQSTGANTVQCINYTRADGTGIAGGGDFSDGGEAGGAARTLGNTDAFDFALETNNIEQLQIEGNASAGIITMPNQSGCFTRGTSQTIAHETITLMALDTADFDPQNEFDESTNYRFTATNAGKYLVICQTYTGAHIDSGNQSTTIIYFNGGSINAQRMRSNATDDYIMTQCAEIVSMGASDYVDCRAYHTQGEDVNYMGNTQHLMVAKLA